MVYYLKSQEDNEPMIQSISEHYRLGEEKEDCYVIDIDHNAHWLDLVERQF